MLMLLLLLLHLLMMPRPSPQLLHTHGRDWGAMIACSVAPQHPAVRWQTFPSRLSPVAFAEVRMRLLSRRFTLMGLPFTPSCLSQVSRTQQSAPILNPKHLPSHSNQRTGAHGLAMLLGPGSVHERLLRLGYEKRWIAKKLADGERFRLALFPARGYIVDATWDGVFTTVHQAFPEVAAKVCSCRSF